MAAKKRAVSRVDYSQLNSLSSVVLYDTSRKKYKRGKLYDVERIIERRKTRYDHEYLIKWKGWSLQDCSWEPSENLTEALIRSYGNPSKPSEERLQEAGHHFATAVLSTLKSSSVSPFYIDMHLDVWRFLSYRKGTASEHRGHILYCKHDFVRFMILPEYWWYYLDQHGEGKAVDFPVKIKTVLTWSPAHHIRKAGKLVKASQFPMEKLCVTMVKRACNINNLDQVQ